MVTFTRKHYNEIANLVAHYEPKKERKKMMETYIKTFEKDNPNFIPDKFKKACGF